MYNEKHIIILRYGSENFLKKNYYYTDFWIILSNRVVGLLIVVTLVLYPYSYF